AETPAEGTILTVAREGIENVIPHINPGETTFVSFFSMVVEAMRFSLDNTPNLLPILKESGVVDSGGKGLLTIFEGFLKALTGEKIKEGESTGTDHASGLPKVDYSAFNENSVLDYGYCTEFLLQLLKAKIDVKSFDLNAFIGFLQSHGNSIVCFQTGSIVKVHIHTKKPYEVIEFAQRFGEFLSFKMENMALQHNEVLKKKEDKKKNQKPFGVIAIAQGDGFLDIFEQMGADMVLNGGQTMNTSTSEILDAFQQLNTKEIVLLPDETNILMAAHQAAELYQGGRVYVLDTKTIPAGYAALSMLTGEEKTGQACYETMAEGLSYVASGFLSQAIRSTKMNGIEVKKGDWIGGYDGELEVSLPDKEEALLALIEKAPSFADRESVILFYGNTVPEKEAEEAKRRILECHPSLEVGLINGGQAVYDYLIAVI
ncbi:MAG: DAK2 domain-containing protein, partial [Bacilli bacterium]|nr:DAK2 domain-containing protein [Bacilli bacterium]